MSSSSLNVLVVEDHGDSRLVFGWFLESLGHRFKLAPDAASEVYG